MKAEDYKLAALGDTDAQVRVANYYDEHLRGERDSPIDVSDETAKKLVVQYYKMADAQGNAEAAFRLFELCYYDEDYADYSDYIENREDARQWLEKSVQRSYIEALYTVGKFYMEGELFEKNPSKAEKYFKLVTKMNPDYGANIGLLYDTSIEDEDDEIAYRWYKVAADCGNSHAMELAISCCEKSENLAWVIKAAESGDSLAQAALADRYYYGLDVERDLDKAFKWYQKSGTSLSQSRLGDYYYFGIGMKENWEEAVQWYQKAAGGCTGDAHAQQMLGNCYFYGTGVEIDFERAAYWYDRAAKYDRVAKQMLADCYYFGKGVGRDVQKAFERYNQEVLTIQTYGDFYYFGLGVPANKSKAFEAYKKAAPYDIRAKRMLGNCYYFGHGTNRNIEKAIHWYRKAAMHRDEYSLEMVNLYYTAHDGKKAKEWFKTEAKLRSDQWDQFFATLT